MMCFQYFDSWIRAVQTRFGKKKKSYDTTTIINLVPFLSLNSSIFLGENFPLLPIKKKKYFKRNKHYNCDDLELDEDSQENGN